MWTFVGLVFIGGVLWYWLRKATRLLFVISAMFEAGMNRAARNRGESKVSDDVDATRIL